MNKYLNYITRLLHGNNAFIKYTAMLLSAVCFAVAVNAQPKITRVEYYVDADPGYGKGKAVPIVAGTDLAGLSFNINLATYSEGVHVVGVRSRDANGGWSLDNKWLFLKKYANSTATAVPKTTRVEYYIDADPGYGKGKALTIVPGTDLADLTYNINMAALSPGVHVMGIRSKDANGAWSLDRRWIFSKKYPNSTAGAVPKIDRVEYFIDADPGYGKGIALPVTPATNFNNIPFNIALAPLGTGVHVMGIRSHDANGGWSIDNKWIFLKPYKAGKAAAAPKITRVEYFVDTDPGYGKATALSIVPNTNLANLSFNINTAPLNEGVHIVGVRSQDSAGAWSLDNRWLFLKKYSAIPAVAQPNVVRMEYYVDVDPGYEKATPVVIVPGKDLSNLSFPVNLTGLGSGQHFIGIRSKDGNGAWSLDNKYAVNIGVHGKIVSDLRKITPDTVINSLRLQYNPVHQQAALLYTVNKDDKTTIRVFDNLGRLVLTKEAKVFAGVNIISLETAALAQGIYTVQAVSQKDRQTVRMMKE